MSINKEKYIPMSINKEKYIRLNPDIKFKKTKKLYFRKYLYKVELHVVDAGSRYCNSTNSTVKEPTLEQYVTSFIYNRERGGASDIGGLSKGRYVSYENSPNSVFARNVTADVLVLFNLHQLIEHKPKDLHIGRMHDSVFLYSNDLADLGKYTKLLDVKQDDIISIFYPDPNQIDAIVSGKEINNHAKDFRYKIFFKPFDEKGDPVLYEYLRQLRDDGEVEIPGHTIYQMNGARGTWAHEGARSYMYIKDDRLITMITMMCGKQYSNLIELALPYTDK